MISPKRPINIGAGPTEPVRPTGMMSLFKRPIVRYLIVGGLSFAIDFGLAFVFYRIVGWPLWIATGVGFVSSFGVNYSLQRMFSFTSHAPHGGALVRYAMLVTANTFLTIFIVTLLNSTVIGWGFGKVVATAVTTVGNYFAYKYWIFASHRESQD